MTDEKRPDSPTVMWLGNARVDLDEETESRIHIGEELVDSEQVDKVRGAMLAGYSERDADGPAFTWFGKLEHAPPADPDTLTIPINPEAFGAALDDPGSMIRIGFDDGGERDRLDLADRYLLDRVRAHRSEADALRIKATFEQAEALLSIAENRAGAAIASLLLTVQQIRLADIEDELADLLDEELRAARR